MSKNVPAELLKRLSEFVSARMGLHFPPERWGDLSKGLESAAAEFGFADIVSFAQWALATPLDPRQIAILASDLTVGETYFFREKKSFELLEQHILPSLIHQRRGNDPRLRIWSAGCCTGEEAYSLAILLNRLLPNRSDWDIRLLATDINPRFLRTAADGIFSEWSFRDARPGLKENNFISLPDGRFQVRPEIRGMVRFDYLNLADDIFPALLNGTTAFDLILCRNVLIYMVPLQIEAMVRKFARALIEKGWLMVGAAETSHIVCAELTAVNYGGMTVYAKHEAGHPPAARSIAPMTINLATPTTALHPPPQVARHATVKKTMIAPAEESISLSETTSKALTLYDQGHYADAVKLLLSLVTRGQIDASVLVLLARASANMGDLRSALRWGEKALAVDRLNPQLHYLCGVIKQELTELSESAACFKRAIYLNPDFIMAHFALGHLSLQRGRIREGTRHFDNALRLLGACKVDTLVPESEGMSAERLAEIISHLKDTNLARSEAL